MNALQTLSNDLETLVATVSPAVVSVLPERGHGSGFVLSSDGYILTNRHVVGASSEPTIRLHSGRDVSGSLVGTDAPTDLAVIKVGLGDLPFVRLSLATPARVGQLAVAIGSPFRFEGTVSLGVVSALERTLPVPGPGGGVVLEGVLQTDAAVNPGNSGGPLLDVGGNVIEITTAIVPQAQGIGFATPATTAAWVAALLIQNSRIERPLLGITGRGEALPPDTAAGVGQPRGVRVLEVGTDTPAAEAGLIREDLVLAVDTHPVGSVSDLQKQLIMAPATSPTLAVWRSGSRLEVPVAPLWPSEARRVVN